jgi:2-methylcitrate dehydratase PrpD
VDTLLGGFGLAGSQAGGTFAAMGTVAVKFHQLRGAQAGVIASEHAAQGLLGPSQVLTAPDGGLLRAFSDDPAPELLTEELGKRWFLRDISMRPYPAASSLQSLINVLVDAHIDVADVDSMEVVLPADAYRMGANAGWETELRAMQSARFVAAGVVCTGGCWTDLFDDKHRQNPQIVDFAANRVHVLRDLDLSEGAVRVVVKMTGGVRRLVSDAPRGAPENPIDRASLTDKIGRCVAGRDLQSADPVRELLAIESVPSVAKWLHALRAR